MTLAHGQLRSPVRRLAWIGLGVSALAALGVFALMAIFPSQPFVIWIEDAPPPWMTIATIGPVILVVLAILISIVLDIIAGTFGGRNRTIGIIGGVVLLLPAIYIFGGSAMVHAMGGL
jgi:hypothetical protein